MTRFLFDTAVFLYAIGADHPYREPCRRLVSLAAEGQIHGEASVEMIQEFVHVRCRRKGDRQQAVREAADIALFCKLHDLTETDLRRALRLFKSVEALGMRDAIHAATALNRGLDLIVSPDRGFDNVPGLARIDPTEAEARLAS